MATTLRSVAAALAALALSGCSWGAHEPGLFRTPAPSATTVSRTPGADGAPPPTSPVLPVAGEAVWTTADGSDVTVRFAVHALRRTENATVLDWSVTPLAAPGRPAGRPLPSGVDLGLGRALGGEQNLVLLDVDGRRVYRPLADIVPARFSRCLCTPLFAVMPTLRFGDTRLLQLAFPVLPSTVRQVDVQLPNVAVVPHVPLTAAGAAPLARTGTDLTRRAETPRPATAAKTYTQPGRPTRRETVRVDRVLATPGLTSVEWTLRALDDQSGFTAAGTGPPVARPAPEDARVLNRAPASGPRLRARRGPAVGVAWTTSSFAGLPGYECLCSELDLWSKGLRLAGGSAHFNSTLPALAPDVQRVDVSFPGLPVFRDVAVVRAVDPAPDAVREVAVDPGTWTYADDAPPRGWSTASWPTPVPAVAQVAGYHSRTERLLDRLP